MQEFVDSTPMLGDPESLRARLDESSYVFFRGLLDREAVLEVRREIVNTLASLQWLAPDTDPMQALPGPNATGEGSTPSPEFFRAYEAVQRLQAFHELAHATSLVDVTRDLIGEDVLVHPRKIFRVSPPENPDYVTPPHQDYRLVQGTVDTLTLWLPLGDCPDELGGLRVLADSHRPGLQQIHAVSKTGGVAVDADENDERWTSTSFQAGDVLVFHSLTVHGAKPNVSSGLRLSADFRYQAVSQPVVTYSLSPHYFPRMPEYSELTKDWTSTRSIEYPPEVLVVEMANPFDPDLPVDEPKLVRL